jgi:hypothetical protein
MKKLLGILMIAGTLAACNSGSDADSKSDSAKNAVDSTADAKIDKIDSTRDVQKEKIDSMASKKDSVATTKENKKH